MVKAETTREQYELAKAKGHALFAFACKSGGTVSCDGVIGHEVATPLIRLMMLVVADRIDGDELAAFVKSAAKNKSVDTSKE